MGSWTVVSCPSQLTLCAITPSQVLGKLDGLQKVLGELLHTRIVPLLYLLKAPLGTTYDPKLLTRDERGYLSIEIIGA